MLKRYQVLLEDWQEDYIRSVTERYDLSFSEILRIFLSLGFIRMVTIFHPEYKTRITGKELAGVKQMKDPKTSLEERHKIISKLYFEARKAAEYRLIKIKGEKT